MSGGGAGGGEGGVDGGDAAPGLYLAILGEVGGRSEGRGGLLNTLKQLKGETQRILERQHFELKFENICQRLLQVASCAFLAALLAPAIFDHFPNLK